MKSLLRLQEFKKLGKESAFFWGPRQTGKSTLLKRLFPKSPYFDLLSTKDLERFTLRPWELREELLASSPLSKAPVILDEVQKAPQLLDEVQWMIVNKGMQFILCGSSVRKLKRGQANLLGGRAIRMELFPLVFREIPDFNLVRALNHGLLPRHYLSDNPGPRLTSYVNDYLSEEIRAEGLLRSIPPFGRFLDSAAFSNGEIVNFSNIARECGVSGPTAREYFQILEDTLMGRLVYVYQNRPKRRLIHAPKFYFFDVGIANTLLKRGEIRERSEAFGKAFEHFIFQELVAHSHYSGLHYPVTYWRTASGLEVDFILGEHEIAVEVKGTEIVQHHHLRGIKAFQEEYRPKKSIVVSLDPRPRRVNDHVTVLPWRDFLNQLWGGKLLK